MKNVVYNTDLCVVGGGLAGLSAAVAAARHGIKVVLMQDRPVLGGNASSEIRMWVCGAQGKYDREAGILEELILENYYRNPNVSFSIWDSVLYGTAKAEENLTLLLNCTCIDAKTDGDRILAVKGWQLTNETKIEVKAKIFADCSGDSILASLTGAEYMLGREAKYEYNESLGQDKADSKTMGQSCLIQAREYTTRQEYIPPKWAYTFDEDSEVLKKRWHTLEGCQNFWWMEIGGAGDVLHDTEKNRDELLKIAFGVWDHVKNHGDHGADNWALDWVGFLPGKRESRRYRGKYIMCQSDVENAVKFDDEIAYGGWPMDDHHPEGIYYEGSGCVQIKLDKAFGIPFRSIVAERIENLGFAGRNISVTHTALSATRVMGTCAMLGQALGTAAALAVQNGCKLCDVDVKKLQQELLYDDCYLPGVEREVSELTKRAKTNANVLQNGKDRELSDTSNNQYIGEKNKEIYYEYDEPVSVKRLRLVLNSNLERTVHNMPSMYRLENNDYRMPKTLLKAFETKVHTKGGEDITIYKTDANFARVIKIDVNMEIDRIVVIPTQTWGDDKVRIFSLDVC